MCRAKWKPQREEVMRRGKEAHTPGGMKCKTV